MGGCSVPRLERAALVCGCLVGFWFFSKKHLGEPMLAQILLVTKLHCAISRGFAQHRHSCCNVMRWMAMATRFSALNAAASLAAQLCFGRYLDFTMVATLGFVVIIGVMPVATIVFGFWQL